MSVVFTYLEIPFATLQQRNGSFGVLVGDSGVALERFLLLCCQGRNVNPGSGHVEMET
jgi:hypothetical protein